MIECQETSRPAYCQIQTALYDHQIGCRARSPFRLNIELPSTSDSWDAVTSFQWAQTLSAPRSIAVALRPLLHQPRRTDATDHRNDFAQLVLVHAVAGLAWDMAHRDLVVPSELRGLDTSNRDSMDACESKHRS